MLIMNVGHMLSLGFEKVLLMYTPSNSGVSDIIDTLVYRTGLVSQNYSYATAIGLFSGIVGLILVTSSNAVSRKLTGESIDVYKRQPQGRRRPARTACRADKLSAACR